MGKHLGLVIAILTLAGVLSLLPLPQGYEFAYASPGIALDAVSSTTGSASSFT